MPAFFDYIFVIYPKETNVCGGLV